VPILEVERLTHAFAARLGPLGRRGEAGAPAVDDVTLSLRSGETLGLVGESGSGKTTLVRCMLRLLEPSAGQVRFRGDDVTRARRRRLGPLRRDVQVVFQDPLASLNPRRSVHQILAGALRVGRGSPEPSVAASVEELLERVGLSREHLSRYPHELSGGQRQRVGIARALAPGPTALLLDEPVSSLDASVRAQVLNLLLDLQGRLGLTYLFVSHDLGVVRHVSDRVAVMRAGKVLECAPAGVLFSEPAHPYTGELLAATRATSSYLTSTRTGSCAKAAGRSRGLPKASK
jgi:ABC-type glutathione transport system ATPase component